MRLDLPDNTLHVLHYGDGPLLFDTNRVTTYSCDPVEAELLGRHSAGAIDAEKIGSKYGDARLSEAIDRLNRLSELSVSLARCHGLTDNYIGHPTQLFLHTCHVCNLQCSYCYASATDPRDGSLFMPEDVARDSIDFFLRPSRREHPYVITFGGGEPLLNVEIIKAAVHRALRMGRDRGLALEFRILTNGTVMDGDILAFISDKDISLQISLDGPPETHDRLRRTKDGCGSFERVCETIQFLEAHDFTRFRVRSTFCHSNSDLPKIVEFLRTEGIEDVALRPVMADEEDPLRLRQEDIRGIAAYYNQLSARVIDQSKNGSLQHIPEEFAVYVGKLNLGMKTKRYCGAGRQMLVVSPEGEFYPCPSLVGDSRFRMGDLRRGLDSEGSDAFEDLSVDEKAACRPCWAKNLCGGGCASQAIGLNGDLRRPDPLGCALTKARIKGAIAIYHHLKAEGGESSRDCF